MRILGLHGAAFPLRNPFPVSPQVWHDAAAVLLEDGEIRFAIEEERLDRIKHGNRFPFRAIEYVLGEAGIGLRDLDAIAYTSRNPDLRYFLMQYPLPSEALEGRERLGSLLEERFGEDVRDRLRFFPHHACHLASTAFLSGYGDCLAISLDGVGDRLSGLIADYRGGELQILRQLPVRDSLGLFYLEVIRFLGYDLFDEYKVMGLAPYGDPSVYRDALAPCYHLAESGHVQVRTERLVDALADFPPRRRGAEFSEADRNLAAALQEALERMAFHLLEHFRDSTGHRDLCLAGGVSLNCTMTGKALEQGMFDRIFVQPAAHDGGCAIGASLLAAREVQPGASFSPLQHVYWGTDTPADTGPELRRWERFVEVRRAGDVVAEASALLASGQVLGWMQGRSEYGPRALGSRSILADPCPAENKDRINAMVKKREAYRPFAPSILEERLLDFFDVPDCPRELRFMNFTAQVKPEYRTRLGAITHVDGSSRLQTVSRATHPRYWELIHAFGERTGIPILLNTSFNNHVEPIVDSVEDAVVCYLTTALDALVVGDFFVTRRGEPRDALGDCRFSLPAHFQIVRATDAQGETCLLQNVYDPTRSIPLDPRLASLLVKGTAGKESIAALDGGDPSIREQFMQLWILRAIRVRPFGS